MSTWSVQDAKAKFSALLEACQAQGPQFVTLRGAEIAVVSSLGEWQRLQAGRRPSLKELLLRDDAHTDELAAPRGRLRRRVLASE
jgi:antitoxin Phd